MKSVEETVSKSEVGSIGVTVKSSYNYIKYYWLKNYINIKILIYEKFIFI
jgi:hypothetical protein